MASETELVTKAAVNKILYDGYQQHLHDCANSVRAAQFIHGLQKAVTALPASPSDAEQLMELRKAAESARAWICRVSNQYILGVDDPHEVLTQLNAALNPDLQKERQP